MTPATPEPLAFHIGATQAGQRLDKFLVGVAPEASRTALARLIKDGKVLVNGKAPRKAGYALEEGDAVTLEGVPVADGAAPSAPTAEAVPLRVLYEDEDLLAVDKPAGLAVHPGPGHPGGTLVNALLGRGGSLSRAGGDERPGIVHRLDKDTSGLILIAKTDAAHRALTRQFLDRTTEKVYVALLRGRLLPAEGIIEAAIARDPEHRQRMAVVATGRESVTEYRVLAYLGPYTLVEVRPRTGRTHQIRVHFASLRHPVAGDETYSRGRSPDGVVPRMFLHAHRLRFRHPRTGREMELASPLAPDLAEALRALTADRPEHRALVAKLAGAALE